MKAKNIIILIIAVIVLAGLYYSFTGSGTSEAYTAKIEQLRNEKNNSMRGEGSPFGDSIQFSGLKYFPIDARYRIDARLTEINPQQTIILPTSDGVQKTYATYAYATFTLDGIENKLLILEIMEMGPYRGTLFLAFADKTSAQTTYGAGRYLDVKKVPGAKSITLDFNEAYNPYCAYNDNYSCPFPPKENILNVEINAGEKSYH